MRQFSLILHLFISLGALFGGSLAMLYPESPMGIDSSKLPNMPFDNFFIPGLILFVIIGLGNLTAAVILWRKFRLAPYATGVAGGALVIWIVVQCYMLQIITPLHVIFFALGAVQGLVALYQLYRERRFPFCFITGDRTGQ